MTEDTKIIERIKTIHWGTPNHQSDLSHRHLYCSICIKEALVKKSEEFQITIESFRFDVCRCPVRGAHKCNVCKVIDYHFNKCFPEVEK